MKAINLAAIRLDGETQSRAEINNEAVAEYVDAIKDGAEFPPIVVFFDGATYWLGDGFHRVHAFRTAGRASINADVRDGTQADAQLFSYSANTGHGLRRSNADKRKAVLGTLSHPATNDWSDNKVAKHCGVSVPFVGTVRASLLTVNSEKPAERTYTTKHGTKATMKTDKIGKSQKPKNSKRELNAVPDEIKDYDPRDDELKAAHQAASELAAENDRLKDQIAVESMDASEEAKTQAAETIADLRAENKNLLAELAAVKVSRDTYQRENVELKKQCAAQQREIKKLRLAFEKRAA